MEKIIGLKDLRENLPAYEKRIAAGDCFVVVKKSKPVFRISPIDHDVEELWEEVIDFTKIQKGGIAIEDILTRL